MYSNLLVPIAYDEDHDGSRAVAVAQALAAPGAKITLLHVMDEIPGYAISYLPQGYRAELETAIRAAMEARVADLENASHTIVEGRPGPAITDYAADHGIDCIVISSHRPGLQDYFLGSTAARVVRHAGCSVHVLR